jgi:alpha-glucosidase (family GH31 glycosyl hydrolase)
MSNGFDYFERQGNAAGYFDFTRPSSGDWWAERIMKIKTDYGFDGFKV